MKYAQWRIVISYQLGVAGWWSNRETSRAAVEAMDISSASNVSILGVGSKVNHNKGRVG